jgi:hypothetical protein
MESPLFAFVLVEDPGCYRIQGQIKSVSNKNLILDVSPGKRNHETLNIRVDKNITLQPGTWLELLVFVPKRGSPVNSLLKSDVSTFKRLTSSEHSFSDNWNWVGEAQNGKCQ